MSIASLLQNIFKSYVHNKTKFSTVEALELTFIDCVYSIYKTFKIKELQKKKEEYIKIRLFNNKPFYVYTSDIGLSFDLIVNNGIREPLATKKLLSILSTKNKMENKTFLDIGANIGYYSIVLSEFFKRIVCVEPSKKCVSLLKKI